jgi:hypothetical protein
MVGSEWWVTHKEMHDDSALCVQEGGHRGHMCDDLGTVGHDIEKKGKGWMHSVHESVNVLERVGQKKSC